MTTDRVDLGWPPGGHPPEPQTRSGVRYIVLGAGAVGGTIGWGLARAGFEVALVARGAHLEAIRAGGLTIRRPAGDTVLKIPTVGSPAELDVRSDDVVIVATKSQDVAGALGGLFPVAPSTVTVACATNGVDAERQALRRFDHVVAVSTIVSATHLEPGVIRSFGTPELGILDLGPYPTSRGDLWERCLAISGDFTLAGFRSLADEDVMRLKYRKLVHNVRNAVGALVGPEAADGELAVQAQEEALAVLASAGIDVASSEEDAARRRGLRSETTATLVRGGSSTWQSLARGTGSVEADYLNGEIALLARQVGVAAPVNTVLQREVQRLAARGGRPGSVSLQDLERAVAEARAGR